MKTDETPDTVHGRLLESAHFSGYSFERACAELEWLLDDDRWKQVGPGYDDIHAFIATVDFSSLRVAVTERKKLAQRLADLDASQRETARMLGVGETTIARDLGKARRAAPKGAPSPPDSPAPESLSAPKGAPAWFAADVDPSNEAKRVTQRNAMKAVIHTTDHPEDLEYLMAHVDHVADVRELQATQPEKFAATEIYDVLRVAIDEINHWGTSLDPRYVGRVSLPQWALLIQQLENITQQLRKWITLVNQRQEANV